MRSDVDEAVRAWAAVQGGAFSSRQVRAAGGDRSLEARRLRAGVWIRSSPGVCVLRGAPVTWTTRLWIAHFEAKPSGVVSHRSAARLHGFYAYRASDVVEVSQRGCRHHGISAGRLHETSILDPEHICTIDGLPVTTVARTFFDLCGHPPERGPRRPGAAEIHAARMRRVLNDAVGRRGLRLDDLAAVLAALGKRGRPGTQLVRQLLRETGTGYQPTESEVEDLFLEVLAGHGLPRPDRQRPLGTSGVIGRVDFVYPEAKLVIEIDSAWHDGPVDRIDDSWRDIELQQGGWKVFRFRWIQLIEQPARVADAVAHALRAAGVID